MDEATKDALLARFRTYLDCTDDDLDDGPADARTGAQPGDVERSDLYSLLVELAGLRAEVRSESRLVKEALDQSRSLLEPLRTGNAALQRDLKRAEAALDEQEQRLFKPLLLELLEIRDRLAAGLQAETSAPAPARGTTAAAETDARPSGHTPRRSLWARLVARGQTITAASPDAVTRAKTEAEAEAKANTESWRAGLAMTLRRLDDLLGRYEVRPMATIGHPFDPRTARAVATEADPSHPDGVVLSEARPGFHWRDRVLRPADVVVNKTAEDGAAGRKDPTP